jgi:SAM-dependent methyltransferase
MEELSNESKVKIHDWTKEQVESASKPNFGKIYVTAPNLLRLIGEARGKSVLELGCGNGYWLRLLKELGAEKCLGIDHAPNQIEAAQQWQDAPQGIEFKVGDITKPMEFTEQCDVVFLEHVLLEITSAEGLAETFRNARSALKPNGKLVVSDFHPFAPSSRPRNLRVADDFNYFEDGASFEAASQRVDGETIYYKDCHWTLSTLAQSITDAGFTISKILEPLPSTDDVERYPEQLRYRLTTPMAIMFGCHPSLPVARRSPSKSF